MRIHGSRSVACIFGVCFVRYMDCLAGYRKLCMRYLSMEMEFKNVGMSVCR
jgi:hypothetical protein